MLRVLVDLRDRTIQKSRIGMELRIYALEHGEDKADEVTLALINRWKERFENTENEIDDDIKDMCKNYPIIDEMIKVKGLGLMLSAKIVAMVDINRADSVSAMWRYCGYGVIDGKRERPVKGEKLHYNSRLKTTLYNVAGSFLKCNSSYRLVYDRAKAYYEETKADDKEWTKGHIHLASMRKMIKVFLSHLWLVWRTMEQLETNKPYVHDVLKHTHYYAPEEFGWTYKLDQ